MGLKDNAAMNDAGHPADCSCPTCLPEAHPSDAAPKASPALIPVEVEGWTLFTSGRDHWMRDLDLAERAELKNPHAIRATIQRAIADGAIILGGDENDKGPRVQVVATVAVLGKGASREVKEYYLNQEAALLLVTRLRTPKAVEVTKAIVRVFLMVARGEMPSAQPAYTGGTDLVQAQDVAALVGPIVRETMLVVMREIPAFLATLMEQSVAVIHGRLDVIDQRLQEASARRGLASAEQVAQIKEQVREIAWMRIQARWFTGDRPWESAGRAVLNDICREAEWGNGARKIERIPAADVARVFARLAKLRLEAAQILSGNGLENRPVPPKHLQASAAQAYVRPSPPATNVTPTLRPASGAAS
jgi:hypothetical protein